MQDHPYLAAQHVVKDNGKKILTWFFIVVMTVLNMFLPLKNKIIIIIKVFLKHKILS